MSLAEGKRDEAMLRVAIVGGGPRGLAACERLLDRARPGTPLALTVFESASEVGPGPNHDPAQPLLDRLNLPLRLVDIPARERQGEPGSFEAWAARTLPDCGPEDYPARADLGRFLAARWDALASDRPDNVAIEHIRAQVTQAERQDRGWMLSDGDRPHGPFDEVLLCPGHQPVEPDDQIRRWRAHATAAGATLMHAYPANVLLDAAQEWQGKTVAIRGLALSMIDVMRLLTEGLGGRFEADEQGHLVYRRSGREPARLLPFSLDGLPPAPKPATAALDAACDPRPDHIERFTHGLRSALESASGAAMAFICEALTDIAGDILSRFGVADARDAVRHWLDIEAKGGEHDHGDATAAQVLAAYLAMAEGRRTPGTGYAVGQVWAKLQPYLRMAWADADIPPGTAQDVVHFDEGLKRFSYGPPPSAAREMLALIDAGMLDLRAVEHPDILLVDDGWRLSAEDGEATAAVMIDAVLASPELEHCTAPLIAQLRDAGMLVPVAEKLGARTTAKGRVLDAAGKPVPGLSLIGRLAIGSVIAADDIVDCFGASMTRWTEAVLPED